ncbi:MAG: amidohydrolase [Magnetococcales bacterium]|nr:amidohydrolase [Magnetococcales bacterium]
MTPLTIENAWLPNQGLITLRLDEGLIQEIGTHVVHREGDQRLDAKGMAVVPGLVNGHTHAAMTLFRGYGDDMPLKAWLKERIWPVEARLSEEDVYWGTKLACLEMIRSGTVLFQDMYWYFQGRARAVEEMGLRAGIGSEMIDVLGVDQASQCQQLAEARLDEVQDFSDRIQYAVTPHSIYAVSRESLRWTADFTRKHGILCHIHLSETLDEVTECLKQHGKRPAFYLDDVGLLHEKSLLAHGVHLDEEELDLIAKRGATLVTNPNSNMKLAVGGVFPFGKAAERGIPIALGTDGAASNNSLDLFQELKSLALIQKHANNDPTALPADEAWRVAHGGFAPVFGPRCGLQVGDLADVLLLRRDDLAVIPNHDFISNLVYSTTGHGVDTMIVAGRIIMQNRRIAGEEEIIQQAMARTEQIFRITDKS